MKLMTYNICNGAVSTLQEVIAIVKSENPDYLTINEANTFAKDNYKILNKFAQATSFSYFKIACWEDPYHIVILSKYPFKEINTIKPKERVYINALIDSPCGELMVTSVHLSPVSEDERLQEIQAILNFQSKYKNRIIMGDMNALSESDKYTFGIIDKFNSKQIEKFTRNHLFRFDVMNKLFSANYFDVAVELKKNTESTVPTPANEDPAHGDVALRLDYILISRSLLSNLKKYSVIKNKLTDRASDHYPIIIEIE